MFDRGRNGPARLAVMRLERSASLRSSAATRSLTVSRCGRVRAPRSRSLMPRALSPARSASASWVIPAARRYRRRRSPNPTSRICGRSSIALPARDSCFFDAPIIEPLRDVAIPGASHQATQYRSSWQCVGPCVGCVCCLLRLIHRLSACPVKPARVGRRAGPFTHGGQRHGSPNYDP